jgi:hypothetical protein
MKAPVFQPLKSPGMPTLAKADAGLFQTWGSVSARDF